MARQQINNPVTIYLLGNRIVRLVSYMLFRLVDRSTCRLIDEAWYAQRTRFADSLLTIHFD